MTIETLVSLLLVVLGVYLLMGLVFALVMLFRGASKLDPRAKGSGWGFKLLIIPGTLVFWPVLWRNWRKAS